ncbi:hypothetical protein [Amycolatopsis marina]|uniref:hypothetical protein n=1 Tax=Amycolatopsis marina TaxID=490629 RepID=UPI000B882245|nr:hypothetical protein [Amycolatopsis marina]
MEPLPAFARGLCDDAAVFPPGLMPLHEAVPAHARHETARYAELVGPLILAAPALADLAGLLRPEDRLNLAVTLPAGPGQAEHALTAVAGLAVSLRALEVAVPAGTAPDRFFVELDRAMSATAAEVFVEVPRDERRAEVIDTLATTRYQAKFRTGGVTAELYPDERELAAAIAAAVAAGVPFKATAGLHHAIRNTDPETGFEQHGFLNLLLATDAALRGADGDDIACVLAERDTDTVASGIAELDDHRAGKARAAFRSFGTCSVTEPLTELVDLGLVPSGASDPRTEKE